MTLSRQPDCSCEPTRDDLWARRCAVEAKAEPGWQRRRAKDPYWEGALMHTARRFLELAGLYKRGMANARKPEFRRLTFEFDTLPPGLSGFRILHLSDFHFCDRYDCVTMVQPMLAGLEVDLVVLTGDFQFRPYTSAAIAGEGVSRLLAKVRSRHGALAVLGNNDTRELADILPTTGARVLLNEHLCVEHHGHALWLAGVDDPHDFRADSVPRALEGIPLGAFTVLLAHSPEAAHRAAACGVDLYLCGHTHGGQIRVPLLGPLRTNARCPRRFVRGLWRDAGMHGYTTTGLGISALPVRFNCPPEVVLLELHGGNR